MVFEVLRDRCSGNGGLPGHLLTTVSGAIDAVAGPVMSVQEAGTKARATSPAVGPGTLLELKWSLSSCHVLVYIPK
jgi:hypothetical protein